MSSLKLCVLLTFAALCVAATAVQAGDVYLGITMSPITSSMARALQLDEDEGVLIDEVVAESPADEAGLQAGDVIVAIEGRTINGSKGLAKAIHRYDPGDEVTITVVRSGDRRDLSATLGEKKKKGYTVWSDNEGDTNVHVWTSDDDEKTIIHGGQVYRFPGDGESNIVISGFGMSDRGFLGIVPGSAGDREGVLVEELVDDAPAGEAGLREGDVIVALDDESIEDGDELHEFLSETEPGQTVAVSVMREGKMRTYEIELAEAPNKLKLSDVWVPGHDTQPRFYSGTIAPHAELEELEREREEVEEMREELEDLKAELQELREELEKKK